MTVFELEDAIVEFVAQNTADFRFGSNEESIEKVAPVVWSGFVPRDEVGSIVSGDISTYPAIIVSAQDGTQSKKDEGEIVSVNLTIGCFDASLDQQGYRDCCNIVQRLKDRFREVDIIREAFAVRFPINWQMNKRVVGQVGHGSFPYFFADMQISFELPIMMTQFDLGIWDGDKTPGRFNEVPIPTPPPLEHDKYPVPPPIKINEHWETSGDIIKS